MLLLACYSFTCDVDVPQLIRHIFAPRTVTFHTSAQYAVSPVTDNLPRTVRHATNVQLTSLISDNTLLVRITYRRTLYSACRSHTDTQKLTARATLKSSYLISERHLSYYASVMPPVLLLPTSTHPASELHAYTPRTKRPALLTFTYIPAKNSH